MALVLSPASVASLPPPLETGIDNCTGGRARRVRRRRVLNALAQQVLGRPGKPFVLLTDPNGIRRLGRSELYASVAERSGWVAAALSHAPIGIDIEQISEAAASAEAVLDQAEAVDLVAWHGLAGVWAAREAALKSMGCDLTTPQRWRFSSGSVTVIGRQRRRVDLIDRADMVAAIAYVGG